MLFIIPSIQDWKEEMQQKRKNMTLIEKKRRERFNEKLEHLRVLVPSLEQTKTKKRVRKEDIIEEAIRYLETLKEDIDNIPKHRKVSGSLSANPSLQENFEVLFYSMTSDFHLKYTSTANEYKIQFLF